MNRWPKRKLSRADGEHILWHMLEYLRDMVCFHGSREAIETIKNLIDEVSQ